MLKQLSGNEVKLILYLLDKPNFFVIIDKKLADELGITVKTLYQARSNLAELGIITVSVLDKLYNPKVYSLNI